jgi:hypothetical protein
MGPAEIISSPAREVDERCMRQAIVLPMEVGGDYGPSILANKVPRPVLVHVVGFRASARLQQFEDAI